MDEQFPMALQPGSVLAGQYVIQKVLGQGGFGITYMAEDHKTGEKVAVKEFFPDTLATRTQNTVSSYPGERADSFLYGKSCFLQEAETLAAFIGSENIVKIHSYFEENGTAYFVMDFVEGISFDEYIRQKGGKIPYDDAERVLIHIIDALALVHSRGIVHRDVTPDNIYITSDGTVKLLDFGAARYSLGDKSRSLDVVLKHGFAPKEQYTRHGRQGPFTDVYTVGASFYFAITGKRPPDSIDRLEEDDLIPPSSLGVDIPKQKEDAILKAMSVQPQDRFQTMGEFKNALLAGAAAQSPQPAGVTNQRVFTAPVQPIQPMPGQPIQPAASQPTPGPTQSAPSQQGAVPKRNNKAVLAAVIAGAAVLFVVIAVSVGMIAGRNSGKDRKVANADASSETQEPTPQPTATPAVEPFQAPTAEPIQVPTAEPTQAPTAEPTQTPAEQPPAAYVDTVEILGNSAADIKNQNMICRDPETDGAYIFQGDGLYGPANDYSAPLLPGIMPYSLSIVGDYLYYVDTADGKAYRVNKNGGTPELLLGSDSTTILAFYVSDLYWFVYGDDGLMCRWNIQEERVDASVDTGGGLGLAAFSDGYLYYVDKTGTEDVIYRVPAGGDWTSPQEVAPWKEGVNIKEICVEGDRIYTLLDRPYWNSNDDGIVDANGKVHSITIVDAASGESIDGWDYKCDEGIAVEYSNMRVEDGIIYFIKEEVVAATGAQTVFIQFDDGTYATTLYADTYLDAYLSLCVLDPETVAVYGMINDSDGIVRIYLIPLNGEEPQVFDAPWNID